MDQQFQSPLFGKLPAEIRLNIFNLALEPYFERPVRHNLRLRYGHDCRSDDDGALSSSVESARFTDSEDDEASDEDIPTSDIVQRKPDVCPENSSPFASIEFDDTESDDSWHPDAEEDNDSEHTRPDDYFNTFHSHLLTWLRPGSLGVPHISTSLLRTCRRAYLEARDTVPANYVHHIWANHAPREHRSEAYSATERLYARLTPAQRNGITSAHLHCSELYKTGPRGLWALCTGPGRLLRRVEHLRLSVAVPRIAFPMFFDPYHPDSFGVEMVANMRATEDFGRGEPPPETSDAEWEPPVTWGAVAWAEVFRYLPSLRSVTMDFDADGEQREAMGKVVEWAARVWRFPLGPRPDGFTYLSAQGNPVEKTSWRGPPCFPRECGECPEGHEQGIGPGGECPWSVREIVLLEKGLGARRYSWTVRWTARVGREWVPPKRVGRCPAGLAGIGGPNGKTRWDDVN